MPNPLIKWAKRNTHSDPPPPPSGAKKVAATSPFPTPTQKERRKKNYLFSDTRKTVDLIVVPFKPFSVAGNQYEEYWNAEHLHVYAMFPPAPLKTAFKLCKKGGG